MIALWKIDTFFPKYIRVFSLLFAFSFQVFAQHVSLDFKHLTTADGLSQSSVIAMAQDHQGMLWIGTRDGLNKYDAGQITIYRNKANDPNSLSNNDILDLKVDEKGNLWIGTYSGLNYYDQKTEKFTRYVENAADSNSISNNTIWSIDIVSSQEVLIGTSDGLNVLNPTSGQVAHYFAEDGNSKALSHSAIRFVYTDHNAQTWIGTEGGLNKLVRGKDQYEFEEVPLSTSSDLRTGLFIQSIVAVGDETLWVGSKFSGLYKLDATGTVMKQYLADGSENGLINNNIRALAVDQTNRLWIGTYDGLNRMDGQGHIDSSVHVPLAKNSLSENKIKSIFCSANGSVWVGTYYGGLNMWNAANFNFNNIKQQVGGLGLTYNVVSSIVEDERNIYFGTEGKGLSIQNMTSKHFRSISKSSHGLTSDNIKALRKSTDPHELWICTFNAGINAFNTKTNEVTNILDTDSGLSNNSVYDIIEYRKDLWIIGTFGGGINLYYPNSDSIAYLRSNTQDQSTLSDDQVRSLTKDEKGNLWVGTQKGLSFLGVDEIANQTFRFKRHFYDQKSESGEDIRVIFEGSDETIWVGSKETGLHVLKADTFVAIDLFSEYQQTSNTIHAIEEDATGQLWISSNNGIINYDPLSETKKLFEESDGLVSNEFNSNSSLKSANGALYFGGPDGVSWFFPGRLAENTYAPQVWITELRVNNRTIVPNDPTEILSQSISSTSHIELAYDQANFTLGFSFPSFINPRKNEYVYRLKGLEEDWNTTSTAEASYIIQKSGHYVFEIKGVNNDGYQSDQLTQLAIRVHPAPWRSAWAFVLYALIIATALFVLYRMIKTKTQLEYKLDLEHKANLQQEELNNMKLQFFTNISHEFRTPLTLILGPLDQIMEEFKGSSVLYKKLKTMQQSANQLLKLINQLMDFRKIENNQDELKAAEGNLVKFVYEIFLSFKIFAKNGNYDYQFESVAEEIRVYFDRDKLERVLYNLISNAFKYTPEKGTISIKLSQTEDQVQIAVSDTGQGISEEHKLKIFDRFYQIKSEGHQKEVSSGTGIGLALAKSIVDLHAGTIDVQSQLGAGSSFNVRLKKGAAHLSEDQMLSDFRDSEQLENYTLKDNIIGKSPIVINPEVLSKKPEASTVLVVEDNEQVRNFIVSLLAAEYNVLEAADGLKGLNVAQKEVPDLIISDVMMPNMDGIEFCSQIKTNLKTSHIPFILLTARTSLIFKYEGLESGADDYLNKPFNVRELELKVKNLVKFVSNLKSKFKEEKQIAPSEITISSIDEELLEKAIQVVDDNIDNQFFDVNLFAKELGVSRTMLFTKIKAWTDMTPNEFILSMRMKRAAQLLELGKCSISQVCYKVGFKNPKYFSKCFNKYYSISPKEFATKFA
ncbi:MAG: two-component regulator propeller domain-containing protein [Reichenbachiella sp.]|uniref:two-component regulator propeller domain-containing protein n=1 Tax=Reichenbachiella sp. TaxID=2184521 RepID=UPI0029663C1C|nr:two-component regulator propeller domain-containing protein [Reichenbachiella sp.]MDW3212024.1 two-component regulator propeller domain-containing protein [Reichenbachiella sp.]